MNIVILIFLAGHFEGAICRELLMLGVPSLRGGFRLMIFWRLIVIASFLLGITAALLQRNRINPVCPMRWWQPVLWADCPHSAALLARNI